MRKLLFLLISVFLIQASNEANAQDVTEPNAKIKKEPTRTIDKKARFKGNIKEFLKSNLKYPEEAIKKGIQGVVVVEFVVDEYGGVSATRVVKGLGGGCNEEALRIVRLTSGNWIPAEHEGELFPCFFTLPIYFILTSDEQSE